ncbi:hypothetical protein M514_09966 [Trichuris suis]|uniref:Uncharacterized protein n=1 Tax=Trichuris suis TaxID=68888 RepID=A0A085LVZ6_9BILA|nr:hypothetical protein M513_09966 [Trichuris suis]KFD62187.1 hypothetical protein M514_09966 [Trichuris suis]
MLNISCSSSINDFVTTYPCCIACISLLQALRRCREKNKRNGPIRKESRAYEEESRKEPSEKTVENYYAITRHGEHVGPKKRILAAPSLEM